MPYSKILVLCWVGLAAAACSGADAGPTPGEAAAMDGPDAEISPVLEEVYVVGALEGEAWETFGNVAGVAFGDDGSLYVLDSDAGHIVQLSSHGDFVRTIGRRGEGPGELTGPTGLSIIPGGEIVIFDFAKQGFQVFDEDGEFVESVPLDPSEGFPGSSIRPTPGGRLVTHGGIRLSFDGGLPGADDGPSGRPIESYGLDGTRETVYMAWRPPPPEETDEHEVSTGGGRFVMSIGQTVAFEPGLHVGVLSDGRLAVADSVAWRVKLVDAEGVDSVLERPIAPTPVDDELRRLERERRLASLSGGGASGRMTVISSGGSGSSGGSIDIGSDQMTEMMRNSIESMAFATEVPVIERLAVDPADRIWVERAGPAPGDPGPTDIVTPDGRYLGTIPPEGVRIPAAFGPDGLVAYIEEDELEIQRVRVARLAPEGVFERDGSGDRE